LRPYTVAQNPWTLHFTDAEIEREYFALQWGARQGLGQILFMLATS